MVGDKKEVHVLDAGNPGTVVVKEGRFLEKGEVVKTHEPFFLVVVHDQPRSIVQGSQSMKTRQRVGVEVFLQVGVVADIVLPQLREEMGCPRQGPVIVTFPPPQLFQMVLCGLFFSGHSIPFT